ncbi:MAG TPA: TIGR04222 domain-containing membrane protein, partial [Mycobacterium sp.]|nr:TIGR04222 domain-containing membrane protein [Mycobacterium sp.]
LAYLEPAKRPAFATYGPAAVALSAALFGTGALWAVDSDYSSAVELAEDSGSGSDGAGCGAFCGGAGGCGGGGGGCGGGGGGCGGGGGGCGG